MSKRVNKLGVDFPSCEGLVSIDHDFPTIQFDHKLVAGLLPGEVVDVSEESLKNILGMLKYRKIAGAIYR